MLRDPSRIRAMSKTAFGFLGHFTRTVSIRDPDGIDTECERT
jgi:hypothetical protein